MSADEIITSNISPENLGTKSIIAGSAVHIPKPVGAWDLGKLLFTVYRRPTDEQIKNTEEFFGWKWVDYE
jgi:hypothetical protein